MNTFVIGDIHGCCKELKVLISRIGIEWGVDRLVLLGDYIDRGNEEHEVLRLLQYLVNEYGSDKIVPLKGNHEQMLLDSVDNRYVSSCRFSDKEINFLKERPAFFEDETWFYVHGGIDPLKDFAEQKEEEMLWIREPFYNFPGQFQKKIAFGHTPTRCIHGQDVPVVRNDRIALDTGCVFGGKLSAMKLVEGEIAAIYSVEKSSLEFRESAA
jgi:serine/threonine protein phosphatase 1